MRGGTRRGDPCLFSAFWRAGRSGLVPGVSAADRLWRVSLRRRCFGRKCGARRSGVRRGRGDDCVLAAAACAHCRMRHRAVAVAGARAGAGAGHRRGARIGSDSRAWQKPLCCGACRDFARNTVRQSAGDTRRSPRGAVSRPPATARQYSRSGSNRSWNLRAANRAVRHSRTGQRRGTGRPRHGREQRGCAARSHRPLLAISIARLAAILRSHSGQSAEPRNRCGKDRHGGASPVARGQGRRAGPVDIDRRERR